MQVGKIINMKGISSWSSRIKVAKTFASSKKKPNEKEVVFINNSGTRKGASISHIAKKPRQKEILVSNEAEYAILKKHLVGRFIFIEVEEKE